MVLNIKAVDLNLIDSATQEFEVGDLIRCVSPPHGLDTNMPLSSITVYLTDLSKNTVTLGSEKSNSTYTSSNAEKASKLDETIKSIPGKREILQEALRNATDLMNDMTKSGYAIHEKMSLLWQMPRGQRQQRTYGAGDWADWLIIAMDMMARLMVSLLL